jgi:NhaP-type Na+/H+ or K+/H+ antiporter
MAGPVVVMSMALIAPIPVLLFKYNWSWNFAFLFGVAVGLDCKIMFSSLLTQLSTTDPVAVVAILREAGVSERLRTLIEGELSNSTRILIFLWFS